MTDPKSILDTVADEANKLFEHAAQQIREGKASAARETMNIAELMSYHVRDIEDHDDRMGRNDEVGNVSSTIIYPGAAVEERPRF